MMIPIWLPWTVLAVLVVAAVLGPESPYRFWGPAAVVLVVSVWLTVDHVVVSDAELFDATTDAAATVDGTLGGVSQDRIRIEIEDRLGRDVRLERTVGPESDGGVSYAYQVKVGESGPSVCVDIAEHPVGQESSLRRASVSAASGTCTGSE